MGQITKKRELLPLVNAATIALSNMSAAAAELEYHDNDRVSRKLKLDLVAFENTEFKNIKEAVKEVRKTINSRKRKPGIGNKEVYKTRWPQHKEE